MFEQEKPRVWGRVLLSVVLLAVLVGGGFALFRMGFVQGAVAADAGDFALDGWYGHPMSYRSYSPMMGHSFFPFGSLLFGFFFLMLVFGLFRRILFGPRWMRWGYPYGPRGFYGPHGHHGHPHWGPKPGREGAPEREPASEEKAE